MKVKATQQLEVEISPEEQKRVALDYLYRNLNWGPNFYISQEDKKVYDTVEHHGYRYWEEKIAIRKATHFDYSVSMIVKEIKTYSPK